MRIFVPTVTLIGFEPSRPTQILVWRHSKKNGGRAHLVSTRVEFERETILELIKREALEEVNAVVDIDHAKMFPVIPSILEDTRLISGRIHDPEKCDTVLENWTFEAHYRSDIVIAAPVAPADSGYEGDPTVVDDVSFVDCRTPIAWMYRDHEQIVSAWTRFLTEFGNPDYLVPFYHLDE